MGGTYFIKIKPRCSSETIYVTRLKSLPTGCPGNIAEYEFFFIFMASFVVTFHFYRMQASLKGNFVAILYTSSASSSCLRHLIALFLVATEVVNVIKKLFVTVISDTVKNTVFPNFDAAYFGTYESFGLLSRDASSKFFENFGTYL